MTFTVIDKKTGEYPDTRKIALREKWASNLIYCDIDGFALQEDGTLILLDECGNVAYCPPDRFEVRFDNENPWHTGIPTQDGWYLVKTPAGWRVVQYDKIVGWVKFKDKAFIKKWQKIEEKDK